VQFIQQQGGDEFDSRGYENWYREYILPVRINLLQGEVKKSQNNGKPLKIDSTVVKINALRAKSATNYDIEVGMCSKYDHSD